MDGSLSGILIVVPGVLLGLWFVGRWIRGHGRAVVSQRVLAFEIGVFALLFLIAKGQASLGLTGRADVVDSIVVAGLFLLLAHRVLATFRALRDTTDMRIGPRPPWPFLCLPLIVYMAVLPWAMEHRELDGDEPYYLLISHSLAYDFDSDLSNNYEAKDSLAFMSRELKPEWADPESSDGHLYSRHNLALPLLIAPAYRVAGKAGGLVVMAALAALCSWAMLGLADRIFPDRARAAITAWGVLAFTPPMLLYAGQIWTEVPAALLTLVAISQIYALREESKARTSRWVLLVIALAFLPLLKLRFLVIASSVALLAILRLGPRRLGVLILIGILILVSIVMLTYNLVVFDKAFKDHTVDGLKKIQKRPPAQYAQGGFGLFFDCAFGLFSSNPIWLLLIPALAINLGRRGSLVVDLLICTIPYLLIVTPRLEWYGAWAPPFRFGIVLLPLLALTLVPLFDSTERAQNGAISTGLSMIALAFGILWLVLPGWTYNLAGGTNHWIDYLSTTTGSDFSRFFPSYVRLRLSSWIVPLIVFVAFAVFWRRGGRARRPAGVQICGFGAAVALLLFGALPMAARSLPTRWVEFEDQQVTKQGGALYPDPWVPGRPRFRGGWRLSASESVSSPINRGGDRAELSIDLQVLRLRNILIGRETDRNGATAEAINLEIAIGNRVFESVEIAPHGGWQTVSLQVDGWSEGERLDIRLEPSEGFWKGAEVILDRARIEWR